MKEHTCKGKHELNYLNKILVAGFEGGCTVNCPGKGLTFFSTLKTRALLGMCGTFPCAFLIGGRGKRLPSQAEALKVSPAPWTVTRVCSQQTRV